MLPGARVTSKCKLLQKVTSDSVVLLKLRSVLMSVAHVNIGAHASHAF